MTKAENLEKALITDTYHELLAYKRESKEEKIYKEETEYGWQANLYMIIYSHK